MTFIGRKKEIELINHHLCSSKHELIIIYGRRRLGKTTLIKQTLQKKNAFYFLCTQERLPLNLELFKHELSRVLNKPLLQNIQTHSFVQFMRDVSEFLPENFIIVLDEFPYLISQDPSIISQFQKIYDEYLTPKKIKLILCGSSLSIMSDLLTYKSPLYGRRTASIKLTPFSFYESFLYFKSEIPPLEITKYHLIFGGVPYYYEQLDISQDFSTNIKNLFFEKRTIFFDEIEFLLKAEFREIANYISILSTISKGKNTFSQIADAILMDRGSVSKYLKALEQLDIIHKKISFFDKKNSKKSIYTIQDNFVLFWYYVFYDQLSSIDIHSVQKSLIERINLILGQLFEKECQVILTPFFESTGSYFRNGIEIDILGKIEDSVLCFECKFKPTVHEKYILNQLITKASHLPKNYTYTPYLISINNGITLQHLLELSKNIYLKKGMSFTNAITSIKN